MYILGYNMILYGSPAYYLFKFKSAPRRDVMFIVVSVAFGEATV